MTVFNIDGCNKIDMPSVCKNIRGKVGIGLEKVGKVKQ